MPKQNPAYRSASAGSLRVAAWTVLLMSGILLTSCSTYSDKVAPVPLPESQPGHVEVEGVKLTAQAYVSPQEAEQVFGFDVRGAGLMPVRFVMDNQSSKPVRVEPSQTFLLDAQGQAWPLLSSDQAYERIKSKVDVGEGLAGAGKPAALLGAAGALVGAAIGIVTGHDVGDAALKGGVIGGVAGGVGGASNAYDSVGGKIRDDLMRQSLTNQDVRAGELAYGYLFFPGKDEAKSARGLRLSLRIGDNTRIVNVGL